MFPQLARVSQKKGQRFAGIQETSGMEKVTGIGGLFFRARDPKALAEWYSKYLGVDVIDKQLTANPSLTRNRSKLANSPRVTSGLGFCRWSGGVF